MHLTKWLLRHTEHTVYVVAASNDGNHSDAYPLMLWAQNSADQPVAVARRDSGLRATRTDDGVNPVVTQLNDQTEWVVLRDRALVHRVRAMKIDEKTNPNMIRFSDSHNNTVEEIPAAADLVVFRAEYLLDPDPAILKLSPKSTT